MSQYVYIPMIIYGREKCDYNAISCGAFLSKVDAVNGCLLKLIENNFISYDYFVDSLEDRQDEIDEADEESTFIKNVDIDNFSEEQFAKYLQNKVSGNEDFLDDCCNIYGDSYYKDGWKFQIDKHIVT